MIKFNQIIRASVVSLTIGMAALCAGQASAYTAQELSDAQADVDATYPASSEAEEEYATLYADYQDKLAYYEWWRESCFQPGGGGMTCFYDTNDYFDYVVTPAQSTAQNYYDSVLLPASYAYLTALNWRDYVANHQNGIPGQP